jgi:predicted Zn-dependent protease with MMP-like domain
MAQARRFPIHPVSLEDMRLLAEEALDSIPPLLRQHVEGVAIQVEEFPTDEVLDELGIDDPFGLLGLYSGISMPHRSVFQVRDDMDYVFLYRRPILDYWCETGEDLFDIVRHVLIHEIGHHFGFSDDDMEAIERQAE